MTKSERIAKKLNDEFGDICNHEFKKKFGFELVTHFDLISMRMYSERADKKKMTKEQHSWLGGFSEGYGTAMSRVYEL